jgi:hypothetical protein
MIRWKKSLEGGVINPLSEAIHDRVKFEILLDVLELFPSF